MARTDAIALGFRAHTGWAAVVALAAPVTAPSVIDRRRIALSTETVTEAMQVYHAAAEQPLESARAMVTAALAATNVTSAASVKELVAALGRPVKKAGLVSGNQQLPGSLEKILASHALIHAAEGEMFRAAITAGCTSCNIPVLAIPGNALYERGGEVLGLTAGKLRDRIDALGSGLGPPWGKDQKEAALVAWMALASR
jgi:hypothetical protein